MPYKGQINNPEGRNSYSGPAGQKEPEYGAVEREKVLTRAAPVSSPPGIGAPRRAQRRAVSGRKGVAAAPSPPMPQAPAMVDAEVQQATFWQAVLADPDASPLTRQYAQRALGLA